MGAVTTGQKAGEIPAGATWRDDVRPIFQESWAATVHDIQAGALRTIHHLGPFRCRAEKAQMLVRRCVR